MEDVKIDLECNLMDNCRLAAIGLGVTLPGVIYCIVRFFLKQCDPDGIYKLPNFVVVLIFTVFTLIIWYVIVCTKDVFYLYKFIKFAESNNLDVIRISNIQDLYKCDKTKAKKIICRIKKSDYFIYFKYKEEVGLLFLTKEAFKKYKNILNGVSLSDVDAKLMEEINLIYTSIHKFVDATLIILDKNIKKSVKNKIKKVLRKLGEFESLINVSIIQQVDLHKLCSYYLPTITKTINGYCDICENSDKDNELLAEELAQLLTDFSDMLDYIISEINEKSKLDLEVEMSVMRKIMVTDGYVKGDV